MRNALTDQLITFTRSLGEALPIAYRHLPETALDQACALQFFRRVRDRWPLDTEHFGKQVMGDWQYVIVAAVSHHEQPAREPLFKAMRSIARYRYHDLL